MAAHVGERIGPTDALFCAEPVVEVESCLAGEAVGGVAIEARSAAGEADIVEGADVVGGGACILVTAVVQVVIEGGVEDAYTGGAVVGVGEAIGTWGLA